MRDDIKYEALSGDASSDTSSDDAHGQLKSKVRSRKHIGILCFSSGCLTAIIIVAITFLAGRTLLAPKTAEQLEAEDWNNCGRNSKVAIARGCVIEPLFYGFMPARCVFRELSDQFPVFEDRTYYTDANMTQPVTQEELWSGKHNVIYTSK
jgi:hypothetical protein